MTVIRDNEDARTVLAAVAKAIGVSITGLNRVAGVGQGTLARYVFKNARQRKTTQRTEWREPELYVSTLLKVLDTAGYEVVVRPKVTGSRREQRLAAIKAKGNGNGEGATE